MSALSAMDALVRSASAKALGWTLLHSLWEGAVIALALAIVLGIARSSRVRYAAACLAMLGLLAGFGITFDLLMPQQLSGVAVVRTIAPAPSLSPDDGRAANNRTPWDASELLPWLAPLWMAGVLLFQLRCLASWIAAGRLRRIGVCGPAQQWTEKLKELRARLRMTRPVTLLESCFAEVPVVIGHLRPVILMPVGLLAGLPAGQMEAILLHELAHIRRADYLVNLAQTLVEGLLFYHPAVWWISGVIRAERENCCDDLVVLTNGDAHEYAAALAALAENRWTMRETALAATGGNLVKRIRRLLAQPEGPRTTVAPVLSVGILIVTGAVALAAWQSPAPVIAPMIQNLPVPSTRSRPALVAQAQTPPVPAPAASTYEQWLHEDVAYIITDKERADFKKLQTARERELFIEEFWKRRDPTPGTARNEFKEEHYRRVAYTNDRFDDKKVPGWKTDRGRIYIQYGPPDEIDSHPTGGKYERPSEEGGGQTVTYPFEQWRYRYIEGIGNNVILEFVDRGKTGEYRLTRDPREKDALLLRESAQQMAFRERRLEELQRMEQMVARQNESAQNNMLATQMQLAQAQGELEKLQVGEIKHAQNKMLATQAQVAQAQRELEKLQAAAIMEARDAAPQQNSVFVSGSGSQAAVVILANRTMLVTIPFEFTAGRYRISISTISTDGKTVWSNHSDSDRGDTNSLTMSAPALPLGSYRLTAEVKDPEGAQQKTYVVNFTVN
jgi:GWxTD domain-containing protein